MSKDCHIKVDYLQHKIFTDLDRLRFYKMHLYISCLSGALELKQKGYPDMEDVNGMIEHNSEQALSFIQA